MSSVKTKAYKSLNWQLLGMAFNGLVSFVFLMVMSRLILPESFGQYAIVAVVIGVTQIFAEFGLSAALIQSKDLTQEQINFAFVGTLGIAFVLCLILIVFSEYISYFLDGKVLPQMVQLASLNLLCLGLGVVPKALIIRELEFNKLFWSSSLSYIIGNIILGITLAFLGFEVYALIICLLITNLLGSIFLFYFRPIRFSFRFDRKDNQKIASYGLGLTSVQLLNQLANQFDKLILAKLTPVSWLGAFQRSQQVQKLPMLYISKGFDSILFSVMSKFKNDPDKIGSFYFSFISSLSFITMYLAINTFFFAEQLVIIILGNGWEAAIPILKILSILIFVQTFSRFGDTFVRATNSFKYSSIVKSLYLISLIVLTLIGFKFYDIIGILTGIILAHIIHALGMIIICSKISNVKASNFFAHFGPVLFFGLLVFGKLFIIQNVFGQTTPQVVLTIVTDIILISFYIFYPKLIGSKNAHFVNSSMKEVNFISPFSSFYNRRLGYTEKLNKNVIINN